MSSKPLITVVTPYYNNADTLHEALDSVFTQTYENIQHILVDDGSADFHLSDVREYIEKNKSDHVVDSVILQTQDNSGTVKAWNLALPYIKGEYVFSLAADDCFYDENVLTDWVNAFLSSGAKILAAKRAVYDVSLRELRYFAPTNAEIEAITTFSPQQLLDRIAGENFIFGCCTAYHKSCYEIIGGKLDDRYRLVEDYPMLLKLLRANVNVAFLDRVVIKYRLGGISNAGNIDKKYLQEADAIFHNECLPYVSDRKKAKKTYKNWHNRVVIAGDMKRYRLRFHASTSAFGLFLYRIAMIVRHPIYMLRKCKTKIEKSTASVNA